MKRPSKAKSVTDILSQEGGQIQSLLKQQESLHSIESQVIDLLPEMLKAHCRVSGFDNHILTISTRSPIWKTRLNQSSTQLISQLRTAGYYALTRLDIQVTPDAFTD